MGGAWIDDLSHELRAPLANLSARLEAMEDGIWPADSIRIRGCRDDVNRLLRLVERIEAVARAEASQGFTLSPVRLDHMIARVAAAHSELYQARDVALFWFCGPLAVRSDVDCLGTVFSELLSNAVQATPPGGRVDVLATNVLLNGQPHVEVRIIDTGRGIAPEALLHLFERFFRADPSRSTLTGGSGLGLPLCHALLRQLSGSLVVESRLGEGSEFRITLPQIPTVEISV